MKPSKTKLCVNFFGSPSSGKTVCAASMFTKLKKMHIDSELVAEFPKDLVLEKNEVALGNQIYVFGSQLYRIQCAYNNTKISLVDSPILLSTIYNPNTSIHLNNLILEQHKKFNNLNLFVPLRDFPHSMSGRKHDRTESEEIERRIIDMLRANDIPYLIYDMENDEDGIIEEILDSLE